MPLTVHKIDTFIVYTQNISDTSNTHISIVTLKSFNSLAEQFASVIEFLLTLT